MSKGTISRQCAQIFTRKSKNLFNRLENESILYAITLPCQFCLAVHFFGGYFPSAQFLTGCQNFNFLWFLVFRSVNSDNNSIYFILMWFDLIQFKILDLTQTLFLHNMRHRVSFGVLSRSSSCHISQCIESPRDEYLIPFGICESIWFIIFWCIAVDKHRAKGNSDMK